jgi:hypothetical protein
MKVALTSACYLDGVDQSGSSRLERNIRYVKYYQKIQEELGFDNIVLVDNASSPENTEQFMDAVKDVILIKHMQHLQRGSGYDYPYCWRALHTIKPLIHQGFKKFLMIDSDYFVVSGKLAKYLKEANSGWLALWSKKYNFPEAACQVLNEDLFSFFLGYTSTPWERQNGLVMETALPFTHIEKGFIADRFGESRLPCTKEIDGYGQCPLDIDIEFRP